MSVIIIIDGMLITIYAKTFSPARTTSRRNFRKRRLNVDADATIHTLRRCAFRVFVCALWYLHTQSIYYVKYMHALHSRTVRKSNPTTCTFNVKRQNIV